MLRVTLFLVASSCVLLTFAQLPTIDDDHPLQAMLTQQAAIIAQLQARIDALDAYKAANSQQVAFNANLALSDRNDTHPDSNVIKFNRMDINIGNAYDPYTGIFTAPVAGLYLFSVKVFHAPPGHLHVQLVKEHEIEADLEANGDDPNGRDSATADAVLHLDAGQKVWLQFAAASNTGFGGSHHTNTFLGALMKAD